MDIIGIGYLGFESPNLDAWRGYAPQVLGLGLGNAPAGDPDPLYLRSDDRRHRIAFHPGSHRPHRLYRLGSPRTAGL